MSKAFHSQLMRTVALQVFLVVVAGCGKPTVEGLIKDLGDLKASRHARQELVQIGRPAVPALIQALGNEKTRFNAVIALGEIGDRAAIKPLIDMLTDQCIGQSSAEALKKITGQDFGVDENAWRAWYEKVGRPDKQDGKPEGEKGGGGEGEK